jgi:hypothetical protein
MVMNACKVMVNLNLSILGSSWNLNPTVVEELIK